MNITQSPETGTGSDYMHLPMDKNLPQEIGAVAGIDEETTYEIEDPKSHQDVATLRKKIGDVVIQRGMGPHKTEKSFVYPERDSDGNWRVGEIELPRQ